MSTLVESFPVDEALPTLAALVDRAAFAAAIDAATGFAVEEATPVWFRWRPGRRAVVLFEALCSGRTTWAVVTAEAGADPAAQASAPAARAAASRAAARCLSPVPIHAVPGLGAVAEWYPASVRLPGLASAPSDAGLVSYRPSQRAVLRSGDAFFKAYASPRRFERALEGWRLAGTAGILAPQLVRVQEEERITVQRRLDGVPAPGTRAAREALGSALARIHASSAGPSRTVTAADHVAAARRAASVVTAAAPWLGPRTSTLLGRLERSRPEPDAGVASHGDFHDGQALVAGGEVALLDFDSVMRAPPAFDVARFAAHRVEGADDLGAASERIADLAAGYGGRPANMDWFLATAVLRRIHHPLRRLNVDWSERANRILEAAEEAAP